MSYRRPKSANKIAKQLAKTNELSSEERMSLLRRTTGIRDEDVKTYQKTEVIRAAIKGVKSNAAVNEAARLNPKILANQHLQGAK